MPRTTPIQQRGNATLSRILDSAEFLIDEDGVFNLTTSAVAKHAGVSIGTVYRYFENVNEIIDELAPGLEDWVQDQYHVKRREQRNGLAQED